MMAIERVKDQLISYNNQFYRDYYHYVMFGLMAVIFSMILAVLILLYQVLNRPLPPFHAVSADNQEVELVPYEEPNLLPDTLIRFASKAATLAYTFNFVNYEDSILQARPFFTEAGWKDFRS